MGSVSTLVFHARPGFDALTGLPDRAAFVAGLRSAADRQGVAVLFLDLDDFKLVNDGFGHEAGDRLLDPGRPAPARRRARAATWSRASAATSSPCCARARRRRRRARSPPAHRGALSAPFDIAGAAPPHPRRASASRRRARRADAEVLLRDADTAMYQAKEAGKDRVELFNDATRAELLRGWSSRARLRDGDRARTSCAVHYQPKVDLASGRARRRRGARALAPRRGLARPSSSRWPRRRA